MEGILLHVLYRGEKANDFASEMERSVVNEMGMGDPFFCKYLCPQGVLEGAIPLSLTNAGIRAALGKHSAGEPMAKLKALKASYDLATTVERFE